MQLSSRFVGEVLPNPGWQSWLLGPAASLLLLAGLALPPCWRFACVAAGGVAQ
jgi:putative ABC transport system permease protein